MNRVVPVVFASLIIGCGSEQAVETTGKTQPSTKQRAGGCLADSAGPWTRECSARWVQRIVRDAGYSVIGTTGSAWIAAGRGWSFYIWATDRSEPPHRIARHEGYRLVGRFAGTLVYDDGVRKFWPAANFIVWLKAGPRGDSIAPTASELAPIIRAARTAPPP